MKRILAIAALGAVAVLGTAVGGSKGDVHVLDPFPFSHHEHAGVFRDAGLSCVACHPVGLDLPEGVSDAEPLPAPVATCHACHLQEVAGAKAAPRACETCHPAMLELMPESHGYGWLDDHGDEARTLGATCSDCHEASTCVECHEDRGAGARSPHGPGFQAVHGIEAATDPGSCTSCHAASTCTSCHTSGGLSL